MIITYLIVIGNITFANTHMINVIQVQIIDQMLFWLSKHYDLRKEHYEIKKK